MAGDGAGRSSRALREALGERARPRATVRGVLLWQMAANGLGIVVVVLYFRFLFPDQGAGLSDPSLNVWVFSIYVALMLVVALPLNAALLVRSVRWVGESRTPTVRERRLVFGLPGMETASALASWIGAAVVFGIVNRDVARVSIGIALAGVVTCTMLYLLLESWFRPLWQLALAGADLPERYRDVGPRLMLAWLMGSGVPLLALSFGSAITTEPLDPRRLAWVGVTSTVAGGAVMWLAARSVVRPIVRIRDSLRQIEQGVDTTLPVDDLGELGQLAQGVNHMAAGIRERERLRDIFGRQVGQAGLADLVGEDAAPAERGDRRVVTVLFVDLRGYTTFAEHHDPQEVVEMLNRFFGAVVAVVNREGGWVNKFEGDAALCIFGAPQHQPDHARRALRAARYLPRELAADAGPLAAGIGVASGEVLAGFVGTPERYEYTVIGDVVNLASRLCDAAKERPSGVLASATTVEMARSSDGWRRSGRIEVRGRSGRAGVFTLDVPEERTPSVLSPLSWIRR